MCAIRRVNEAHSKLQLNWFCLKKIIILFWSNEQYMQRTTGGAAGNGLYTTNKYMHGAAGIGLGTTTKHLRRTTSGAAGNGLGAAMKYLRRTTSAAAKNGLSTTIIPPCNVAAFVVNSEPHTGARP
jgi:hypothetical protein